MVQVLKKGLPWIEENDIDNDNNALFVNRRILECKVFHAKGDENSIRICLEVSPPESDTSHNVDSVGEEQLHSPLVILLAGSFSEFENCGHYICHSFLSDAETGEAIEEFPRSGRVTAVQTVSRVETKRRWSCGPSMQSDGCMVSGLKFSFEDSEPATVVLHCWCQCKPIPFCGDPMSPRYISLISYNDRFTHYGTLRSLVEEAASEPSENSSALAQIIRTSVDVGLLPADFLSTVGYGFCPFDASGLVVLAAESFSYYKNKFDIVEKSLGIGHWKVDGRLYRFRDLWRNSSKDPGFAIIEVTERPVFGVGAKDETWRKTFENAFLKDDTDSNVTALVGHYESIDEFLALPDHLMVSRELNGCRQKKNIKLLCTSKTLTNVLRKLLNEIHSTSSSESFSVRFTMGASLLFQDLSTHMKDGLYKRMKRQVAKKCALVLGCKGGSLGYHLVSGNEGRNVFTLHGSLENILEDLKAVFMPNPGDETMKRGNLEALTKQRATESDEVMALRISNPSVEAVLACAVVLGDVPYDPENNAIYPVQRRDGNNLKLSASCLIIIQILETMRTLAGKESLKVSNQNINIRFREIH